MDQQAEKSFSLAEQPYLSVSPHISQPDTVPTIMRGVLLALLPAALAAVYFFGMRACAHMAVGIAAAVLTEYAVQKASGMRVTIHDYSAAVTGLLLAMNLPSGAPLWIPATGSFFAVAVVKLTFGGLGNNILNPALAARAFLLASWPVEMTTGWGAGFSGSLSGLADAVTAATPLSALKESGAAYFPRLSEALMPAFTGNIGGCIGETSVAALLAGALFMRIKGYIRFRIPFSYVGTVFVLAYLFGGGPLFTWKALDTAVFHVCSGGLVLGAFFMATDMVTSPVTPLGQVIFGAGCGVLTVIIRLKGGYPEGVSYSILLMNLTVPLIDRYVRPRRFGTSGKGAKS